MTDKSRPGTEDWHEPIAAAPADDNFHITFKHQDKEVEIVFPNSEIFKFAEAINDFLLKAGINSQLKTTKPIADAK